MAQINIRELNYGEEGKFFPETHKLAVVGLDEELNNKANVNGYYESMGVGTAVNLAGQIERTNNSMYRTSGGTEDIATGTARIESIKGNTIAWNQLSNLSKSSSTYESNGFILTRPSNNTINIQGTYTGTDATLQLYPDLLPVKVVSGHKYYISGGSDNFALSTYNNLPAYQNAPVVRGIYTATGTGNATIYIRCGNLVPNTTYNDTFVCNLIDLTLIYGEGNEPTTVEQFEADYQRWFCKPLTYEPYDEGSLRSVKMSGLKTVGFNQWDEEWEVGSISGGSGQEAQSSNAIRSKNYFKVVPNTQYYKQSFVVVFFYRQDKSYISYISDGGIITTPSDCYYMRFATSGASNYGTTYKNDICINLHWSGVKDGTYEPYEEHTISIPTTTMTGKLNGEGESVVIFPDGMKGVGDVHDELYYVGGKTYAVKRVGSVDLGASGLGHGKVNSIADDENKNGFYISINNKLPLAHTHSKDNCVCSKYTNVEAYALSDNLHGLSQSDMSFMGYTTTTVYFRNDSYKDLTVEQIRAAESGTILYYVLATPLVYEVDDFTLPARYQVNDWGTEEQLQASGANGVAAILSVLYGVNAVDVLRRLPQNYTSIGADSNDNQNTTMRKFLDVLGAAMGGSWAITVNENDPTDFGFTFTPNATQEETNTNTEGE